MNTETIQPSTQTPEDKQRSSFMTALSLAEQLVSESTTLPYSFDVQVRPTAPAEPQIRFYFHMDVPGLRQFRDDHMLTETAETRDDGSVYIEATRVDVRGVRIVAWTLTDPAPTEVTA